MPLAKMQTQFSFFTFSRFGNVNTLRAQLIVPPNSMFAIFLIFHQQNLLKKQYFPHISYENCEINSIKIDASRAFQQHQEHTQIPIQFSVPILLHFHWENGSIINSFHIIILNKVSAPVLIESFPKLPRVWHEAPWFGKSQHDKIKQNVLLHR